MNNEQLLIEVIKSRKLIDFYYEDRFIRKAAPHAIYISSTGKENLDAYQYDGYSDRGNLPAWRIFTIEKMENIVLLDEKFDEMDDYKTDSERYINFIFKI